MVVSFGPDIIGSLHCRWMGIALGFRGFRRRFQSPSLVV